MQEASFVIVIIRLLGGFLMLGEATCAALPGGADHPWMATLPDTPALRIPVGPEDWATQKEHIRARLRGLLGELPPRPAAASRLLWSKDCGGYRLDKFDFDNGAGERIAGYVFVPSGASRLKPAPGIVYCHWHGGQYDIGKDELLGTNATPVVPGPALAERGYVVLGIDACGFGERNGSGPDGFSQRGSAGEASAAKFHLWAGRTLWGMMVRDDLMALDLLSAMPEVDSSRIGVTGISMGSTRTWWLMAMDDRPRAGVAVACMTRYRDLIQSGMLKAHGIYYFVPGVLAHFDAEAIIACAAPRPMLFMTGDQDGGSPVAGVRKIGDVVGGVYNALGAREKSYFVNRIYEGVGHVYLPEMWEETLRWFDAHLKTPPVP